MPPKWMKCDPQSRKLALKGAPARFQDEALWAAHPPLPKPRGIDWLAKGNYGEKDRRGQSFKAFATPGPHRNFPTKRMNIVLQPIGDVDDAPPPEVLVAAVQAFYEMPVTVAKPLKKKDTEKLEFGEEEDEYGKQLMTPSAHAVLAASRPKNSYCVIGYTMWDLGKPDFSFVFGEADTDSCTGIFSFARYREGYEDDDGEEVSDEVFNLRCARCLCHEIGHLTGMKHCVYGVCLMNGSNNMEEGNRRPFKLCPVCEAKLHDTNRPLGGLSAARDANVCKFLKDYCDGGGEADRLASASVGFAAAPPVDAALAEAAPAADAKGKDAPTAPPPAKAPTLGRQTTGLPSAPSHGAKSPKRDAKALSVDDASFTTAVAIGQASDEGLYTDASFPADESAPVAGRSVNWLRPAAMTDGTPMLFAQRPNAGCVKQGAIGDCFFIAATAVLAQAPSLIYSLFSPMCGGEPPPPPALERAGSSLGVVDTSEPPAHLTFANAAGAYAVKLFHNGAWRTIVVDDRIPCDDHGRPLFGRSTDPNELWVGLLEKAYAKLYGSYDAIVGGNIAEALRDLTGLAATELDLTHKDNLAAVSSGELWEKMKQWRRAGNQLATSIANGKSSFEGGAALGLLYNHAYSILDVRKSARGDMLVCIREPHASYEWAGDWSPTSSKWTAATKEHLRYDPDAEETRGTFWIAWKDFRKHFNRIDVLFSGAAHSSAAVEDALEGEWRGQTAAGNESHAEWRSNPQYVLEANAPCRVTLTLSQPDVRKAARAEGVEMTYKRASLQVLRMKKDAGWGPALTNGNYCVVERTAFWNKRDVALELEMGADCDGHAAGAAESRPPSAGSGVRAARALAPLVGSHIVMPSCWDAGEENDYIISMRATPLEAVGSSAAGGEFVASLRPLDWSEAYPHVARVEGSWSKSKRTAGGQPSRRAFASNPQYTVRVTEDTKVFAFLMQKDGGGKKGSSAAAGGGTPRFGIATHVMPHCDRNDNDAPAKGDFLGGEHAKFTNAAEVSRSFVLKKSDVAYTIVPSTWNQGEEGAFRLTLRSDKPLSLEPAPKTASVKRREAGKPSPSGLAAITRQNRGSKRPDPSKPAPRTKPPRRSSKVSNGGPMHISVMTNAQEKLGNVANMYANF